MVPASGASRSTKLIRKRLPRSIELPANAPPYAQTVSPRSSCRRVAGWVLGVSRIGSLARNTRHFCRPRLALTRPKCRARTSFMPRVRCLIRPPASTRTVGAAWRAMASASSSSAARLLGNRSSTSSASRNVSGPRCTADTSRPDLAQPRGHRPFGDQRVVAAGDRSPAASGRQPGRQRARHVVHRDRVSGLRASRRRRVRAAGCGRPHPRRVAPPLLIAPRVSIEPMRTRLIFL